jgi:hypothetical protein
MLSSDKNVETIAQLIEVLKHYLGLQKEYMKLELIDKVVSLLTATALAILFFLITIGVLMFFWFGVTYWLSSYTGMVGAFFIVAGINAFILLLFVVFRRTWIERPLVQFLARLFMS